MNGNTSFIKKALELSEKLRPEIKSKEKRLAAISGEKESTVKNWLFHNKLPVSSKRLSLSDKFGVSETYLFSESSETNIPLAVNNKELSCYLVPQIEEINLSKLFLKSSPLVILDRIPLKINKFVDDDIMDPNSLYCFEAFKINFPPFITTTDIVFINPTAPFKNNTFCLYRATACIEIVQVHASNNNYVMYTKKGEKLLTDNKCCIIPILLTISRRCFE
jgi:hypothetical protein